MSPKRELIIKALGRADNRSLAGRDVRIGWVAAGTTRDRDAASAPLYRCRQPAARTELSADMGALCRAIAATLDSISFTRFGAGQSISAPKIDMNLMLKLIPQIKNNSQIVR
jgi:hypothetical protein